jgi:type III secretion system YscD/HrpQ family protein
MAIQHTYFVLKVLTGINAGASVRLKTGRVVIGRSMSSDIILHDENIADLHVQLLVTPAGITLQPLVIPVFVEGQEVAIDGVELHPGQIVRLGQVEFMVTDARKDPVKSSATYQPGSVATDQKKRDPDQDPSDVRNVTATALHNPSEGKKTWRGKVYLGIGLGLLLLANALFFAPQFGRLMEKAGFADSAEKRAGALLESLGQQDFKLLKEPDGTVSLRGYTQTTAQRNVLMNKVQQAGIRANLHIWSNEDMADSSGIIARSLGEQGIKMSAGETGGQVVAEGFVSKSSAWDHIKGVILSDVGGVQSIDDGKLQSIDRYLTAFVQSIGKKGLSSRIDVVNDGKQVIVKGELTQQEIETLKVLRKDFIDTYGVGPAIVLQVTDVRDRIKLAIRSVSVGKVPFLVSKDGKKYMEGSALGEKYFVKSIQPDHVVLTNNGVEIPLYYGIEEGKK